MKVYLAAQFRMQQEIRERREELKKLGIEVTSRWLEEPNTKEEFPRNSAYLAGCDLEDISHADVFVLFTEFPYTATVRGGRHFESGYAYGLGKPILCVGPIENIFHYLPDITIVPSWHKAKELLKSAKSEGWRHPARRVIGTAPYPSPEESEIPRASSGARRSP